MVTIGGRLGYMLQSSGVGLERKIRNTVSQQGFQLFFYLGKASIPSTLPDTASILYSMARSKAFSEVKTILKELV